MDIGQSIQVKYNFAEKTNIFNQWEKKNLFSLVDLGV